MGGERNTKYKTVFSPPTNHHVHACIRKYGWPVRYMYVSTGTSMYRNILVYIHVRILYLYMYMYTYCTASVYIQCVYIYTFCIHVHVQAQCIPVLVKAGPGSIRSGCLGTPSSGLTLAAHSSLDTLTPSFMGDALFLPALG